MISPHGSCKFGDTRRCTTCLGRGAVSVGTHWLALEAPRSPWASRVKLFIRPAFLQLPCRYQPVAGRAPDTPLAGRRLPLPAKVERTHQDSRWSQGISPDPLGGFSPLSPSRPFAPGGLLGLSPSPIFRSQGNPVERWVCPLGKRPQGVCPTQAPVITERTTLAVLRAKDRPAVPFGG